MLICTRTNCPPLFPRPQYIQIQDAYSVLLLLLYLPPFTLARSKSAALLLALPGSSVYTLFPPVAIFALLADRPLYPGRFWKCLLPPPIEIGPTCRWRRMQKWVPQTIVSMKTAMSGTPMASPRKDGLGRFDGSTFGDAGLDER